MSRNMEWEDQYLGDKRFFDLVDLHGLPPNGTLEGASGQRASEEAYETDPIRRVDNGWRTSFRSLTCEQVRLLLSQKAGLEWLAVPILEFAERYPQATIANYPGELVLLALRDSNELAAAAPAAFASWISGDFSWFDEAFGSSRPMLREARNALADARSLRAA